MRIQDCTTKLSKIHNTSFSIVIEIRYILIWFIRGKCFQRKGKHMGKKNKGESILMSFKFSRNFENFVRFPHTKQLNWNMVKL